MTEPTSLPSSTDLAADLWLALKVEHPEAKVYPVGNSRLLVTFPTRPGLTLSRVEARGVLRFLEAVRAEESS